MTDVKPKNLFDHISAIRTSKQKNYYNDLSTEEKKSFNQFVILMGLSMDLSCIEETSFLSKYINVISDEHFYAVCRDIIPYTKKYSKWIKSEKIKFNEDLIELVSNHFEISRQESIDYINLFINTNNIDELKNLVSMYGYDKKELEKFFKV